MKYNITKGLIEFVKDAYRFAIALVLIFAVSVIISEALGYGLDITFLTTAVVWLFSEVRETKRLCVDSVSTVDALKSVMTSKPWIAMIDGKKREVVMRAVMIASDADEESP